MPRKKYKISYIRKPFAKKSFTCLMLSVVSLALGMISLTLSVRLQGAGELNVAAWGISSFLFAFCSLVYGGLSLFDREGNYLLSKIGMGISGGLLIFWICLIIVGLMV